MDEQSLRTHLARLPLAEIRYFDSVGSTNDAAMQWIADGAADGSLVVADTQTAGRGRLQRRWVTRPGVALAFSLVLRPQAGEAEHLGLFSPLGALALSVALHQRYGLHAQIKWPNDVLLQHRKVAGLLAEAAWLGNTLQGIVLGIGVNVASDAVPPAEELLFPATSVEAELGQAVDRMELLRATLAGIFAWRPRLGTPAFLQAWEDRLAFKGEAVQIEQSGQPPLSGKALGIDPSGNLVLQTGPDEQKTIAVGDVHLRPTAEQ